MMRDSGLQPDPPPDAYEKKIRIGCGALFGICVGLYVAAFGFGRFYAAGRIHSDDSDEACSITGERKVDC